ncbi:hypothetical protein VNO78_26912 [Psophocarpus tetragonolobus]|uniref:Uncharacterized protein n=1 Tax=Psophocarpus tetragonolobus TaxID=3891 RepID=A0AAN9XBA4_PSOTE
MAHMSYNKVSSGKISRCNKGFRLNPRKLYVLRLCKKKGDFKRDFKRNNINNNSKSLVREEKIKSQDDCRMKFV